MYNPFLPQPAPLLPPEQGPGPGPSPSPPAQESGPAASLSSLWKSLHLDELDTGDVLSLLILLFLFLDDREDHLELLITLGLMLLL